MTPRFSDATARALRHADQVIREAARGDVFAVYDACRAAVGAIAPLDDFYVALLDEPHRQISYPYLFSNGRYLETGAVTYGPSGVVAWVLASRQPYRYKEDAGALLNRGVRFGSQSLSADAAVVPLLNGGDVLGLLGALSDTPASFDDEIIGAMQWLAGLVVKRVVGEEQDRSLKLGLIYPELESGEAGTANTINRAASTLTTIADTLTDWSVHAGEAADALDVEGLVRSLFEVQALLVTRLGSHGGPGLGVQPVDPLTDLTPRERAVVECVAAPDGDPGNAAIANKLGIGPATVKTHLGSALKKLGLHHRSELRWLLRQS